MLSWRNTESSGDVADGPIVLVAEFRARTATQDELAERLVEMVTLTRSEPGCIQYDLHRDQADPLRLVFVETWASTAALEAHNETAHVKAMLLDAPRLTTDGVRVLRLAPMP